MILFVICCVAFMSNQALLSAVFINVYVVGLNQLFDVEIDKVSSRFQILLVYKEFQNNERSISYMQVNKPSIPLASGEFSLKTGALIVALFCIMVHYRKIF